MNLKKGLLTVTTKKKEKKNKRADEVGDGTRQLPIFPELIKPLLERLRDAQTLGEDQPGNLALPVLVGKMDQAMDKPLNVALKKAGVDPCPRLWHNLRANRQTELLSEHPLPLVCKWLGNSVQTAAKHYVFPKDSEHNAAAVKAAAQIAAIAAQSGATQREMRVQPPSC